MRVVVGCDHAGFRLKPDVLAALDEIGVEYEDLGCFSEEPQDFPDIAKQVAKAVAAGECDRGILICGTGIGMSLAANKVKGIRAALCADIVSARFSRSHNDANVLTLGGRIHGPYLAAAIVKEWMRTEFESGEPRHSRRINKIAEIEKDESRC